MPLKQVSILRICPFLAFFISFLSLPLGLQAQTSETQAAKAENVLFSQDIAPILAARCQGCHHDGKASMGFNLQTLNKMKKGGKQTGPDGMIVPGKPEESRLIDVLLADAEPRMPLKLKALSDEEIQKISTWIAQGARLDQGTADTPLTVLAPPERALEATSKSDAANSSSGQSNPAIAVSQDSKTVLVTEDQFLHRFALGENGLPNQKYGPFSGQPKSVWISPDNSFAILATNRNGLEGRLIRINLKTGQEEFSTLIHSDQILAMSVDASARLIVTGSYDKTIALTSLKDGQPVGRLVEHTDAVYDVVFDPSSPGILASASGDRTVKIWDLKTQKRIQTFSDSTAELYSVAISDDGRLVFAGGVDRTIRAWDLKATPQKIIASALAHEGPITHLQMIKTAKPDRVELISISEDQTLKRWHVQDLKPVGESISFKDWVMSKSFLNGKLALGLFDGSVFIYQWNDKPELVWQKPAGQSKGGKPDFFKPQLFRFSSLGTPNPRFIEAGRESIITLSGAGVENPLKIWVEPENVTWDRVVSPEPKANSLQIKLKTPAKSQFDFVTLRVATAQGITGSQKIAVIPSSWKTLQADSQPANRHEISFGQPVMTTLSTPDQKFQAWLQVKKGELLTLSLLAKRMGSAISPKMQLKSEKGELLSSVVSAEGRDPLLSYQSPTDQKVVLELSDMLFTGSGNHFAFLLADHSNILLDSSPAVVAAGSQSDTMLLSTSGTKEIIASVIPKNDDQKPLIRPVQLPQNWRAENTVSQLVSSGPISTANLSEKPVDAPHAFSSRFHQKGETHSIAFRATKAKPLVIESYARRLGRETDTLIEITDASGNPVNAYTFRKVADTLIAFRDHGSRQKGIRLTQWADFAMADHVLIGREIARIFQLPRNPDDDCQFFGDEFRWGFFGTTPEQHSMGQTVTKLELLDEASAKSIDPNLLHRVPYINDDAGAAYGNDSHLIFHAPESGTFYARVRETSQRSGPAISYALTIREPVPDYSLSLNSLDWSIPVSGSFIVTASIRRLDGFHGPVQVTFENLPDGWMATGGVIESGQLSCDIQITPSSQVKPGRFGLSQWNLQAKAEINGKVVTRTVSGSGHGWVITPESNLRMTTSTNHLKIRPGTISTMVLKVARKEPFAGRVPIDVRNLPYGVRVLDIGLNGVLITESQQEREIRVYCEPWVKPQSRPFFAVGRAESAGTADASPAVMLEVEAADPNTLIQQAQANR